MAVIGVKSITGITSITNAAGGADVLTFHSNNTTERVRIASNGRVGINSTVPQTNLDVQGGEIYYHSGTSNNLGIKLTYSNGNSTGIIDTYGNHPLEVRVNNSPKLRITSAGHIVTQGLTSYSFNNDTSNSKILEVTGDGTVGEYGVINISGNQDANNYNIGNLRFVNRQNSNGSSGNNAGSKQVAAIQSYIKTSDTNAGDDSGGILTFHTKGEAAVNGERLRIDETGRVLIGNYTDDIGDGTLQVYTADRKHPAIRTNSPNANGYTMFSDSYQADESQVNIGVSYSSSSLVLSRCCKVSDAADNTYLSSQDTYNARPTALVLDHDGALRFHTTETNATTTTDSAVSLTEVFKIDKVGNIYQRISNRYMWFGASNQLQIGVNGSDPYINAASGDLQIRDAGNPITVVRSDGFQMYQDIYFATAGKGIVLGTTSNTDAHTLDHYQEGTTDLVVKCGSVTVPLLNNTCRWTRVGNVVNVSAWIRISGGTSASGISATDPVKITGFPFATTGNGTGRTRLVFTGYSFYNVANASALWGWMVVGDGATSTEHELHWGNANWSGLTAPDGNNITNGGNYVSAEIYINGHMFV